MCGRASLPSSYIMSPQTIATGTIAPRSPKRTTRLNRRPLSNVALGHGVSGPPPPVTLPVAALSEVSLLLPSSIVAVTATNAPLPTVSPVDVASDVTVAIALDVSQTLHCQKKSENVSTVSHYGGRRKRSAGSRAPTTGGVEERPTRETHGTT